MLQFKPNVTVTFSTSNLLILDKTVKVFDKYGYDCTVTGGLDGTHGPNSAHYKNMALDFRTYHVPEKERSLVYADLCKELPKPKYDVILESDHIHVEENVRLYP